MRSLPLSAREAVAYETPASRATSCSVTGLRLVLARGALSMAPIVPLRQAILLALPSFGSQMLCGSRGNHWRAAFIEADCHVARCGRGRWRIGGDCVAGAWRQFAGGGTGA
ncbi:hypothetical protein Rhe02_08800 [Rhizocola hellebori]|uniref:Uncharacterized protein n=1 Tax=Rhizocola hellebori TaxID=1392758 RepID=A0A8J3Q3S3_9ACTN|nr:hypothetical protein Rhe02_08800 [Rhizocola hellebori]